jgi:hypothetical protein
MIIVDYHHLLRTVIITLPFDNPVFAAAEPVFFGVPNPTFSQACKSALDAENRAAQTFPHEPDDTLFSFASESFE